ncbi:MAG: MBL fold metallo-hydrolase RNA specificity domain-containing protein, partial [Acutalibacteraceae bacterium]|nr:MBL fold metallo-hydrolase RNA specificity domain-containing protein [Acutalibacteraceae bacterium]
LKLSVTSQDSVAINIDKTPKIILSASRMCEAGRIRHHLKHNLWRKESTILFVGYQAEGTLGRSLTEGADTVRLFGESIKVNAHIEQLEGISGHADQKILLSWLDGFKQKPKMIFVNHGEDGACDEFAKTITEVMNIPAVAPHNASSYDLITGICEALGNTQKIKGKSEPQRRPSAVFDRLLTAYKRLGTVIEKYRHGANKDIAAFADIITNLCNKWDK